MCGNDKSPSTTLGPVQFNWINRFSKTEPYFVMVLNSVGPNVEKLETPDDKSRLNISISTRGHYEISNTSMKY